MLVTSRRSFRIRKGGRQEGVSPPSYRRDASGNSQTGRLGIFNASLQRPGDAVILKNCKADVKDPFQPSRLGNYRDRWEITLLTIRPNHFSGPNQQLQLLLLIVNAQRIPSNRTRKPALRAHRKPLYRDVPAGFRNPSLQLGH